MGTGIVTVIKGLDILTSAAVLKKELSADILSYIPVLVGRQIAVVGLVLVFFIGSTGIICDRVWDVLDTVVVVLRILTGRKT